MFQINMSFAQFTYQTVLFCPLIRPCQLLHFQTGVDMGLIAIKGCSAFQKNLVLVEPYHQIV